MEHHANLLWIPLASPYNTNQVSNFLLPSDPQSSNINLILIKINYHNLPLCPGLVGHALQEQGQNWGGDLQGQQRSHTKGIARGGHKDQESEKQNITKVLSLPQMLSLHKKIQSLEVEGKQFEDICSRWMLYFVNSLDILSSHNGQNLKINPAGFLLLIYSRQRGDDDVRLELTNEVKWNVAWNFQ